MYKKNRSLTNNGYFNNDSYSISRGAHKTQRHNKQGSKLFNSLINTKKYHSSLSRDNQRIGKLKFIPDDSKCTVLAIDNVTNWYDMDEDQSKMKI